MTVIAEKLKSAGYATHQVGKWDAGMATSTHIPKGRGFDSSLCTFTMTTTSTTRISVAAMANLLLICGVQTVQPQI